MEWVLEKCDFAIEQTMYEWSTLTLVGTVAIDTVSTQPQRARLSALYAEQFFCAYSTIWPYEESVVALQRLIMEKFSEYSYSNRHLRMEIMSNPWSKAVRYLWANNSGSNNFLTASRPANPFGTFRNLDYTSAYGSAIKACATSPNPLMYACQN